MQIWCSDAVECRKEIAELLPRCDTRQLDNLLKPLLGMWPSNIGLFDDKETYIMAIYDALNNSDITALNRLYDRILKMLWPGLA